jgi:DNA-binding MarR family transcriptional regulator
MDGITTLTKFRLFSALMAYRRPGWHPPSIAGCNPGEIRVLFCIKRGINPQNISHMKVSEISKQLYVTPPTITQVLNSLEANGLIERQIDKTDRRVVSVKLTKKGEIVTQQAEEAFSASINGLIEYLGEEQSNQLADLLSKAFRYFNEREAPIHRKQWDGVEEA